MVSIRSKKTGALAALFALFLLSCTIAVLAGYGYVLTAVHDTYMNGSLTPPITETGSTLTKNVREITAGTPQPWSLTADYNRSALPNDVHVQNERPQNGCIFGNS